MKYPEYIRKYWDYNAGEHHLVAIFIIPLLQDALGEIPVYVNPDGMKSIHGDIVYNCAKKKFSIEVKLNKLQLTKKQCTTDYKPDILLYFNQKGIGIADWNEFQNEYIVKMKNLRATTGRKYNKYGPTINFGELKSLLFGSENEILPIITECYKECNNPNQCINADSKTSAV